VDNFDLTVLLPPNDGTRLLSWISKMEYWSW